MALHIRTNLQATLVNPTTNPGMFNAESAMTLNALQELVGGAIQLVNLKKPLNVEGIEYIYLVVNEEGKLSGLPFNAIATKLAKLDRSIFDTDVIVGNAVILTANELN